MAAPAGSSDHATAGAPCGCALCLCSKGPLREDDDERIGDIASIFLDAYAERAEESDVEREAEVRATQLWTLVVRNKWRE